MDNWDYIRLLSKDKDVDANEFAGKQGAFISELSSVFETQAEQVIAINHLMDKYIANKFSYSGLKDKLKDTKD